MLTITVTGRDYQEVAEAMQTIIFDSRGLVVESDDITPKKDACVGVILASVYTVGPDMPMGSWGRAES